MRIATTLLAFLFSSMVLAARVEVDVAGMTCGMCEEAITKELKATGKVENILVSSVDKKARFSEMKDKKISDTEIKAAIKKAGYEAVKVRRKD
ncbi:MAG: heavy-metal-associated domain-containing protein [Bacteriovoracaceae bacterium]